MKYYVYYLVPDRMFKPEPIIYAFTEDKKLSKMFEETRNMEIFKKRVMNIPKEKKMLFEYEYSERRLIQGRFRTFDGTTVKGMVKKRTIKIPCTVTEEESIIIEEEKYIQGLKKYLVDVEMLDKEYVKYLYDILYIDMYCFCHRAAETNYFYKPYYEAAGVQKSLSWLEVDEFKLFLKTRSNMFKLMEE